MFLNAVTTKSLCWSVNSVKPTTSNPSGPVGDQNRVKDSFFLRWSQKTKKFLWQISCFYCVYNKFNQSWFFWTCNTSLPYQNEISTLQTSVRNLLSVYADDIKDALHLHEYEQFLVDLHFHDTWSANITFWDYLKTV